MRARLMSSLADLITSVDADAAILWRAPQGHGEGVVLLSSPEGLVHEGTAWPNSADPLGVLARSGPALDTLVPPSVPLRLPVAPRVAWVDDLAEQGLRLLVIWGTHDPHPDSPEEIRTRCRAGLREAAEDWFAWRSIQIDQARLAAVLASLEQAVITIDDLQERSHLNPAAGHLLGLPPGAHPSSLVSRALAGLQARVINQDAVQDNAGRIARDPMATIPRTLWAFATPPTTLAVTSAPILGERTSGRVWVFDDVSWHADLVREADERFRSAMHGAAIGMCLVEPDGRIIEANEAMCLMFGRTMEGLLNAPWPNLAHPDDVGSRLDFRRRAVSGEIDRYRRRQRCRRADGSVFWVDVASSCVRDDDGEIRYFIDHLTDITAELAAQQELAESEQRLRAVSDSMLDPQVLVVAERDGEGALIDLRYRDVNVAACAYLSLTRDALLAETLLGTFPGVVESGMWDHFVRTVDTGEPLVLQDFLYDNDILGIQRRYDIQGARVGDGLAIIWRDVTDRYEAAARIAESEKHFRLLAENTSDVVILMQHWRITWISPSVETTLGIAPDDWIGRNPIDLVHPDDIGRLTELVSEQSPERNSVIRMRVHVGEGRYHWMDMNASRYRDSSGRPAGFIASGRLADDQVAAEVELQRLARYDSLTGLLNRGSALERLEHVTRDERRSSGTDLGLLFCDIDFFKQINDSHGHAIGDVVLATMARRITDVVRIDDTVARMGGDEILVILPRIAGMTDATSVAEKVRRAAREPIEVGDVELRATLSIGATVAHPGEPIESLLLRADSAMYQAKDAGRDRVTALRAT